MVSSGPVTPDSRQLWASGAKKSIGLIDDLNGIKRDRLQQVAFRPAEAMTSKVILASDSVHSTPEWGIFVGSGDLRAMTARARQQPDQVKLVCR